MSTINLGTCLFHPEGNHDKTISYNKLAVVIDSVGDTYTSKKDVPIGIEINNTEYWTKTASLNAQINKAQTDISSLINTKGYVMPEMFGAKGDGFTDDTEAIKKSINSCLPIFGKSGSVYAISDGLTLLGQVRMSNIKFIAISNIDNAVLTYNERNTVIENVFIDCNNKANDGISGSSTIPLEDRYIAKISNCEVVNALRNGFDTGVVRTNWDNCLTRNCGNAGFIVSTSDTKHDKLVPIDCKYGLYVKSGNTNIGRFHPWSWEKLQIGLYVESDKSVYIQHFYNDTNHIAIVMNEFTKIHIAEINNFCNKNAPNAMNNESRMVTTDSTITSAKLYFGHISGGNYQNYADYFKYPDMSTNNICVEYCSLFSTADRFIGKKFRETDVAKSMFEEFLSNFTISCHSLMTIESVNLLRLSCKKTGYIADFYINFNDTTGNAVSLTTLDDIIAFMYNGNETNNVDYYISSIQSSYSSHAYHTAYKENSNNYKKGFSIRLNEDKSISGILKLRFRVEMVLY